MSAHHLHCSTILCPTPCADPTLTVNNLRLVMASVKNWYEHYRGGLDVPGTVCDGIRASTAYQTEEEKKEALLFYYLRTMPMASWQNVAGALHRREEVTALQAVKAFLKSTPAGQLIYTVVQGQNIKTVFLRNLNIIHAVLGYISSLLMTV